jgi:hypothetical protein
MTNARSAAPLKLALSWIARNWNPVAVSRQTKKPYEKEWQKRVVTKETAAKIFNGGDINVGVQLGPHSHGLNDVDLDCPEAVQIGGMLLPKTGACFGRKSKPRSHHLYVTDLDKHIKKASLQFHDVDGEKGRPGTMLLELRFGGGGLGSQTVFPGSVHHTGEKIEWFDDGEPLNFDGKKLLRSTRRLAAVVLLARHWPIEGARHKAALVLGGFLARGRTSANDIAIMVEAAAKAAADPEWTDRVKAARDAANAYINDGTAYGIPALIEAFGKDIAEKVIEWLGFKPAPDKDPPPSPPPPPPKHHTLVEVHAKFQQWLGEDYDIDAVDLTCCAGASSRLTGDSLWPLIISGAGAAKTETVQSLSGAGAQVTSTIASEGALLSATSAKSKAKGATGGLLRKIVNNGILVIKDVTSIISADRNTRAQVLAAVREIYDGKYERNVGTDGGQTLTWAGRLTIVGACTTAWDSAHTVISIMGDRFVLLRIDSTNSKIRRNSGKRAIRNTGDELQMRKELAEAVGGLIAHASLKETRLTDEEEDKLVNVADIVTVARTGVEFDHQGDISMAHAPEMPTRFAKQLTQIVRGGVAIGLPRQQGMHLAMRCARDSIPPLRLEIMRDLKVNPSSEDKAIRQRIRKPWRTVKRQLDALVMLGILVIDVETETTKKINARGKVEFKTRTFEVYNINDKFDQDMLAEITAAAPV